MEVFIQQVKLTKPALKPVIKTCRAIQMDAGGGGGGKGAVPEFGEVDAAGVAGFGLREDFLRLHIHKAQAHRPLAHNAFKVAFAAAAAEMLFRVERYHRMAGFPETVAEGIAAITNAGAESPNSNQAV